MMSSYTTRSLEGLIAQAYPSPEWAVFFEVHNQTGFGASRRADAIALGIWPSRGQSLIGFEFKEDRGDWLREKKNPAKAETVAAHCDAWYVVAGRDGIVKLDELPEPWGLLVASEDRGKLLHKKTAIPFPDRDKSIIRRSFVAAMLRKFTETTVPKAEIDRLVAEGTERALAHTREGHELKYLRETCARQKAILDHFEKITGIKLDGWQGHEKIAAAVDAVLHHTNTRRDIESSHRLLTNAAKHLKEALDAWPPVVISEIDPDA